MFFAASLPWALLVFRARSTKIGLFCHVGMLLVQWLLMSMAILAVVLGLLPARMSVE